MMLCNSLSFPTPPRLIPTTHHPPPRILQVGRRRGISVVTRAGPPSTSTYIFAFVFPFSLLAVTVFTSIRIADKLEQKFLEELAVNQAILEAEEADAEEYNDVDEVSIAPSENDDDEASFAPSEKEPPAPVRRRNRPKREVEPSSL